MRLLNRLKPFTVLSGKFAAKNFPGARYLQAEVEDEPLLFNCGGYCMEDMEDATGAEEDAIEAGIKAGIAKASNDDDAEALEADAESKKKSANEKRRKSYAAKKAAKDAAKAEEAKKARTKSAAVGQVQGAAA